MKVSHELKSNATKYKIIRPEITYRLHKEQMDCGQYYTTLDLCNCCSEILKKLYVFLNVRVLSLNERYTLVNVELELISRRSPFSGLLGGALA